MEVTFNPTSYNTNSVGITSPENGLNPSTNASSYTTLTPAGSISIKYYFSINLPEKAVLDSISCRVRSWVESRGTTGNITLQSSRLRVGQATISSTKNSAFQITINSLSEQEMNDLLNGIDSLYLEVASNNTLKGQNVYFGGADLIITYHVPDPAIKSVKIYKKISGTWEAQEDYSGLFTEIEDSQST